MITKVPKFGDRPKASVTRRPKRKKQPTQKAPMERILVLRNNRRVFEWRAWGS